MSVTFRPSINNHTPDIEVTNCPFCCDIDGTIEVDSCNVCNCTRKRTELKIPRINLSNGNARAILQLLGIFNTDLFGDLANQDIPELRRKIVKLLSLESLRKPGQREDKIDFNANIFSFGIGDEYIISRLKQIDEILIYCQQHNESLTWD